MAEAAARRAAAHTALKALHAEYIATCGPFFVELPFRAASVPGWVYLPIEDCVILMETARRLADGLGRRLNAGSPIDQAPFEPDPDAGGS